MNPYDKQKLARKVEKIELAIDLISNALLLVTTVQWRLHDSMEVEKIYFIEWSSEKEIIFQFPETIKFLELFMRKVIGV